MKDKKKKVFLHGKTITMNPYGQTLNIVYGDKELFEDYTMREIKRKPSDKSYEGLTFSDDAANAIIYVGKDLKNYDIISHEVLHAVLFLFGYIDYSLDLDDGGTHEPLTYMMEYIMKNIFEKDNWKEYNDKSGTWKQLK